MSDSWVQCKENWLKAVARDRNSSGLPHDVAIMLSTYFNHKTHEAYPLIGTLADYLGVDKRAIKRALRTLEKAGFVKTSKGLLHRSNSYWMGDTYATHERVAPMSPMGDTYATQKARRGDTYATQNLREGKEEGNRRESGLRPPLSEPPSFDFGEEGNNEPQATQPSPKGASPKHSGQHSPAKAKRGPAPARPFPPDWVCDIEQYKAGYELTNRAWGAKKIEYEFGKFRGWCKRKNIRSYDWMEEWRNWITKGLEYEKRHKQQQKAKPKSGRQLHLEGVREAYENFMRYNGQRLAEEASTQELPQNDEPMH
jgi:hypothetical protein